ncbi:MAG: hypothetical protein G01um10147_913 [Microgenomates group bacterium Gr01-1014_7]|nr:MAG: hypothetical protein G01um10147_913 [Microgenomates group bacterium Gr01-1014_7]
MVDLKLKAKNIEQVAIFGSSHTSSDSPLAKKVFEVAKKLAEAGYTLVDGGGPGVMRAATDGAKAGGGKVVGITFVADKNMHYEGRDPLNKFDIEIKTKNFVERTLALLREGQIYVCFNGGTGTISEFGMAWGLAKLYFGHHKPLILYGRFWEKIIKAFRENMLITTEEKKVYKIVDSPEGVLKAIVQFEQELERGEHKHLEMTKDGLSI